MTQPLQPDTLFSLLAEINNGVTQLETHFIQGLSSGAGSPMLDQTGLIPGNQRVASLAVMALAAAGYSTTLIDLPSGRSSTFQLYTPTGSTATTQFMVLGEITAQQINWNNTTIYPIPSPYVNLQLTVEGSTHTTISTTLPQPIYGLWDAPSTETSASFFAFPTLTATQDPGAVETTIDGVDTMVGTFSATFQYFFNSSVNSAAQLKVQAANIDIFRLA
jgi:hypothetical protein